MIVYFMSHRLLCHFIVVRNNSEDSPFNLHNPKGLIEMYDELGEIKARANYC